jgi:DNA-binding transcriptional MerR regulator/methylmalonyl-CoA mutase cobalamin-binding subunit
MAELHPIKVVTKRTGLTAHTIRAWEKRYGAVVPQRTPTNRRLYTSENMGRLLLLRRATILGRSIGQIANLPTQELRRLIEKDEVAQNEAASPNEPVHAEALEACAKAIETLDADKLLSVLERESVSMSRPALIEEVIVPLLVRIGDRWRDGSLRAASEHLASATLRTFLGKMNGTYPVTSDAPRIIVTTPAGQVHELGALMAGAAAAAEGWQVAYLGPSLPAEDIVAAVETNGSRAVALSIILAGDAQVVNELEKLGHFLPESVAILVGGRAAAYYDDAIQRIHAVRLTDLMSFRTELEALRYESRIRKAS